MFTEHESERLEKEVKHSNIPGTFSPASPDIISHSCN